MPRSLMGQVEDFHDGHLEVDDCFALLQDLAHEADGSASTTFSEIYEASQRLRVRIFAKNSPFDMKDPLKTRGYWSDRSDGCPKSWWIEVNEDPLDDELCYFRAEIYRYPDAGPPTRRLTAFDRYCA